LINSEEEARPVASSLPYVDTSYDERPAPNRRHVNGGSSSGGGKNRPSATYVEYDNARGPMAMMEGAGGFEPSWAAATSAQPPSAEEGGGGGEEEVIPMEAFPAEEEERGNERADDDGGAVAEDFVSTDAPGQLPAGAPTTPGGSAPTYLQQPLVRRKGPSDDHHHHTSSSSSSSHKDD
jgi:hypothetical protein